MQPITISAALLAALPAAMAGSAVVINNCASNVNVWTADTERGQIGPEVIKKNGGKWSEEYYMVGDGSSDHGGVSLKLTTLDSCEGAITQYEYTLSSSGSPDLWYDISNVNCKGDACPFYTDGFYLDGPTVVDCGPLTALCDAVYNLFNDDLATHGTDSSEDLTLYLCGKDGSSSSVEVEEESSTAYSSSKAATSFSVAATSSFVVASSTQTPTTLVSVTPTPTPAEALVQVESFVSNDDEDKEEKAAEVFTQIVTEYATAVVTTTTYAKRTEVPHVHMHKREHQHHGHPHFR